MSAPSSPGSPEAALQIVGLHKSFPVGFLGWKRRTVLRDLSLCVRRNEVLGYLGPNGSGKTTTLKILMGLLFPDRGSLSILGFPLSAVEWRHRVGFLPEHPYFYDYLTPAEYLDYVGRLFRLPAPLRRQRALELLQLVGLTRSAHTPLRRFSKGMLQRLGLAQALINDPEIVFLDEPMSGLDPIGRHLVRGIILGLKQRGKTVFFSTHILSDAETLCDRVALLRRGELLKVGRLDEILGIEVEHMEVMATGMGAEVLAGAPAGVREIRAIGERWCFETEERVLGAVVRWVEAAGGRILSVYPVRQSLEEYFFKEMAASDDAAAAWGAED